VEKEALDQAISEFKKIPSESNLFADSRRSIATILSKQNKKEEAVRTLEESIQAKPNDGDLYLVLAALWEKENEPQKALAVLQQGLERNKENTEVLFQLGAIYDKTGDFDKMVSR
jgi:tetratricopeptide (TPR) repeat protein